MLKPCVWWVEYETGGKRYRQSCKTGRRDTALAYMNAIKTAARMPTFEDAVGVLRKLYAQERPGVIQLGAAWPTYLDAARSVGRDRMSDSTRRHRERCVKNLVKWLRAKRPLVETVEAVTQPVAAAFAASLADGRRKTKTRANIIGELSCVWRMLEKVSTGVRNPWANLAPKITDSVCGRAFTDEQLAAVLEAARRVGKDWWPVCTLAVNTGLRYGDVATLRWAEIAEWEKPGDGGVLQLRPRKTRRFGIQTVFPIIGPISAALAEAKKGGDDLFPLHSKLYGKKGRGVRRRLSFREVLAAAGLDGQGFTFHSLRHTAATRLARAGVGLETRKRILGHTVDEPTSAFASAIACSISAIAADRSGTCGPYPSAPLGTGNRTPRSMYSSTFPVWYTSTPVCPSPYFRVHSGQYTPNNSRYFSVTSAISRRMLFAVTHAFIAYLLICPR